MKRALAKKSDGMRYLLTMRPRSIAPGAWSFTTT
jgi:hypothetical protein